MTDPTRIIDGFFKGIPIRIDAGTVTGGRKNSEKQFPNRDTQTVEDLGLRPRTYLLRIIVAPITTQMEGATNTQQSYFEYRNALLQVLENKAKGTLIHPFYGRIDNVKAVDYTLDENFSNFGSSTITVTFKIDNDTGVPRKTFTTVSQVASANDALSASVQTSFAETYTVSDKYPSNFLDAKDKINQMIETITNATSFVGEAAIDISDFNSTLDNITNEINSLVGSPSSLATEILGLYTRMNNLYALPENLLTIFSNLFNFGNSDEEEIAETTVGRAERRENRNQINIINNVLALGYAYTAATEIDFTNVVDIDTTATLLEDQFQAISEKTSDLQVIANLESIRVLVQQFFEEERKTAKQLISIHTYTTSARLLTYQYYGDTTDAEEIISVNNISDASFIEGDLEIFTV